MAHPWTAWVRRVQPSPGWRLGAVVGLACVLLMFPLAVRVGGGAPSVLGELAPALWTAGLMVWIGLGFLLLRHEVVGWLERSARPNAATPSTPSGARRMHATIAALGHRALVAKQPAAFVTEAAALIANALEVDACDIWQVQPNGKELRLRASAGWDPRVGEKIGVEVDADLLLGFTFLSGEPAVVQDASRETRYRLAEAHAEQGITSAASVVIRGPAQPYGVLAVHTRTKRAFSQEDVLFLQAISSVMAATLAHKRSEQAVRETHALFHAVVEGTTDAVYVKDLAGRYLMVNSAGAQRFGKSPDQLVGVDDAQLYDPECAAKLMQLDWEIMTSAETRTFEEEIKINGLSRRLLTTKGPYRDHEHHVIGLFGVSRDITDEKIAEAERAQLYEDAQEAVRARDEFLSIASHELKTPLTSLQLQLQSALRVVQRGGPHEKLEAKLDSANGQAQRLGKLINHLLDISRISARRIGIEPEEVDLAKLVRDLIDRSAEDLERSNCKLTLHCDGPVLGRWDPFRLDQIVTNLLSNAMKYGHGKPIEVAVETTTEVARLSVTDHGIGIAAANQARIFGRFERAVSERHFGGFGLGLWIVRQIIESHGGTIRVASEPGAGSTFTVELPRWKLQQPPDPQRRRGALAQDRGISGVGVERVRA